MCGRYRRRSDKQRIAEAFAVHVGLDELQIEPEEDIAPGSIQPVVCPNDQGERQIELMRWGFKKEDGRLLFNALFGMAGLWSRWKNPKSDLWEDTFAIMTVDANETMASAHDRQPAILEPREYRQYLEEADRPPVHLLRILPSEEMDTQEVDREIITNKQVGLFDSL